VRFLDAARELVKLALAAATAHLPDELSVRF
jgi:hypothetical protein